MSQGLWLVLLVVFSCIIGVVLGLVHLGIKRLPVAWQAFVEGRGFCCMMAVLLMFFAVGVRDMNSIRGVKALDFVGSLKVLLEFFLREQSNTVLQRSLRVLNFVLFCCIWGLILFFFFVSLGAKHLDLSWLWFSNEDVLTFIVGFLSPLIYQGVKSVRRMGKAFFKRVVLMGR